MTDATGRPRRMRYSFETRCRGAYGQQEIGDLTQQAQPGPVLGQSPTPHARSQSGASRTRTNARPSPGSMPWAAPLGRRRCRAPSAAAAPAATPPASRSPGPGAPGAAPRLRIPRRPTPGSGAVEKVDSAKRWPPSSRRCAPSPWPRPRQYAPSPRSTTASPSSPDASRGRGPRAVSPTHRLYLLRHQADPISDHQSFQRRSTAQEPSSDPNSQAQ